MTSRKTNILAFILALIAMLGMFYLIYIGITYAEPKEKVVNRVIVKEKISKEYETLKGTEFKLTAYCSCQKCCGIYSNGITATGTKVKEYKTIAVDPKVIPLGSKVIIEGFDTIFIAEDTGSAIKGKKIDIYFNSHNQALKFGVKHRKIWVIN